MKSIQLTQEQRDNLLEMCIALFPTYHHIKWGTKFDADEVWGYDSEDKPFEIHWFEFCMTHLSTAIFNKLYNFDHMMTADLEQEVSTDWDNNLIGAVSFHASNPTRIVDVYPDGKIVAWHPVEYLYEQFKKIKWLNK